MPQRKKTGRPYCGKWDWAEIKADYRQGVLSVRAIAKKHGMKSATQISKKARREGWDRSLLDACRARAAEKLANDGKDEQARMSVVSYEPSQPSHEPPRRSDEQLIEEGATAMATLVREHRGDLRTSRELCTNLIEQLRVVSGHREELREAIIEFTEPGQRRVAALRSLSLASNAATMRELAYALKLIVPLEREAFGVQEKPEGSDITKPMEQRAYQSIESFAAKMETAIVIPVEGERLSA